MDDKLRFRIKRLILGKLQISKTILVLWFFTMSLAGCLSSEKPQTNDPETVINTVGLSTEELTEELLALRESQKKLERLSDLESDLMLILNELSKQPKLDERPEGYRLDKATETVIPQENVVSSNNGKLVLAKEMLTEPGRQPVESAPTTEIYSSERLAQLKKPDAQGDNAQRKDNYLIKDNQSQTIVNDASFGIPTTPKYILWLGFFVSEQAAHAGSQRLQNKINFQAMGLNIEVVDNANQRGQYYGLVLTPFQNLQRANSFCSALSNYGQYCKVRPAGI